MIKGTEGMLISSCNSGSAGRPLGELREPRVERTEELADAVLLDALDVGCL
jgi:hypothetical protein